MIKCPYCGKWLKNKQALRAHLKHCPLKGGTPAVKKFQNVTEERFFEFAGAQWHIVGKKGFMNILQKIDKKLKEKGYDVYNRDLRLKGALYALQELGIIKKFEVKPIRQQQQQKKATVQIKA